MCQYFEKGLRTWGFSTRGTESSQSFQGCCFVQGYCYCCCRHLCDSLLARHAAPAREKKSSFLQKIRTWRINNSFFSFFFENSHLEDRELLAKNIKVGGGKLVAAAYDDAEYHCSKEELEMRTHSRFLGSREGGQIHIIGQERLLLRISHPLLCYSRAWTAAFLFWFPPAGSTNEPSGCDGALKGSP